MHCKAAGKVAGKAAGRKLRTARLLAGSWLHRKAARQKCRTWLIAAAKIASGGGGGGGGPPQTPLTLSLRLNVQGNPHTPRVGGFFPRFLPDSRASRALDLGWKRRAWVSVFGDSAFARSAFVVFSALMLSMISSMSSFTSCAGKHVSATLETRSSHQPTK